MNGILSKCYCENCNSRINSGTKFKRRFHFPGFGLLGVFIQAFKFDYYFYCNKCEHKNGCERMKLDIGRSDIELYGAYYNFRDINELSSIFSKCKSGIQIKEALESKGYYLVGDITYDNLIE